MLSLVLIYFFLKLLIVNLNPWKVNPKASIVNFFPGFEVKTNLLMYFCIKKWVGTQDGDFDSKSALTTGRSYCRPF